MLKNMPRGVETDCPPGQPILGTFVFGVYFSNYLLRCFFHGKPFFGTLVCTVSPIPHLKRCATSASTYKLGGVGGLSLTTNVIS